MQHHSAQAQPEQEFSMALPDSPIAGLEYGFTVLVAVFLLRWLVTTLATKLDKIEQLLEKQVEQNRDVHSCLDSLKRDFEEARKEATGLVVRLFGEKPKDNKRNWRE